MSFFLEKKLHEKPCDYWLIYQLIQIEIQPKNISLEQICYKRSQGIAVTSLHCLLFSTSKNKDLKLISKSATSVV